MEKLKGYIGSIFITVVAVLGFLLMRRNRTIEDLRLEIEFKKNEKKLDRIDADIKRSLSERKKALHRYSAAIARLKFIKSERKRD